MSLPLTKHPRSQQSVNNSLGIAGPSPVGLPGPLARLDPDWGRIPCGGLRTGHYFTALGIVGIRFL